ncbi:prepilin-type N-terminal cleavage/methylation domain-containing protein [Thermoanaerobacterium thermosaccharolyticum]|uniref:Prepilin-type N-terminal cleavage/methylation domain-containing protein n=1 Tax=Thermoanaerobacterium thermosaccharolyticum M0795 TaxID=698948 RepID=L0IHA2_THETR|nr:prepilin-type N-terminal cleavage/methylation domain-containing protein [Thermoanaerobacterium thermosaccharolyticum]AGB18890.1 prepilin-type N-terminal cleavage/methylation domain-containing protein [Thermoanaerobacterium thermosaccharolyticum M0795]
MRTKESGLTLIELITVISILSIIVLITVPKTDFFNSKTSEMRLRMVANELISDIRYVQYKNIHENESLYLILQSDHKEYDIYKPDTMVKRIKSKKLPDGIMISWDLSQNPLKISFSNQGAPTPGGCTISLLNSKKRIDITILPATGRVMIKGNY